MAPAAPPEADFEGFAGNDDTLLLLCSLVFAGVLDFVATGDFPLEPRPCNLDEPLMPPLLLLRPADFSPCSLLAPVAVCSL